MREIQVSVASGDYAVIDFGGTGPDILLLHQVTSCAQVWVPLGRALSAHAHPVAVDLCGHGHTRVQPEDIDHLVGDLPDVVARLGLTRPIVLVEHEELVALLRDELRRIGARAVVVVPPSTGKRGADARDEYEDTMGVASIDQWDDRTQMFATGTAADKEEFLARRLGEIAKDWACTGTTDEQNRAYLERQLRDTPEGWERIPRRPLVEQVLGRIEQGPTGLDIFDDIDLPVWLVVGSTVPSGERDALRRWAQERETRHVVLSEGHNTPDSFDPPQVVAGLTDLLAAEDTPDAALSR